MKNLKIWLLVAFLGFGLSTLAISANEQDQHQEHSGDHGDEEMRDDNHEASGHGDHEESAGDEHGDGGHGGEEEEEGGGVTLSDQQIKMAGIVSETLQAKRVAIQVQAPGETRPNAYTTIKVAPRISAQIVNRHVVLGDDIKKGQALVTLSSVEMAQAQGELLVASREWQRVKELGRKLVSGKRYTGAKVNEEQARARVQAYGMTQRQINALLSTGSDAPLANGRFQLLATQKGTVIRDAFVVGELVEAGRMLFEISDESTIWVEARLMPEQASQVKVGAHASVEVKGKQVNGKVIQVHHALDEQTRTLGVRIEIQNANDFLHPGLFVQARINGADIEQALAVPSDAILRSPDGDWQVFIEHEPNKFEPSEVEIIRNVGDLTVIEGLEPGVKVVTQGAFFLQSELAKSGFSVHNH